MQTPIWKCAKSINKKGSIFDTNMSTVRRGCNSAWEGVKVTNECRMFDSYNIVLLHGTSESAIDMD
jgi:hypothetical protein